MNFPITFGGNYFCGRQWAFNDINAGMSGLEDIGVPKDTIHQSFKTSPVFFGGNCDRVGWNGETGFGLVIGASKSGDAVYGIYISKDRLTKTGRDLIRSAFGEDALEPEPEGPSDEELAKKRAAAVKKAEKAGVPGRFIEGASAEEIMERVKQVKAGDKLDEVKGAGVAVAKSTQKAYDEKASKAK